MRRPELTRLLLDAQTRVAELSRRLGYVRRQADQVRMREDELAYAPRVLDLIDALDVALEAIPARHDGAGHASTAG